jgi:hypothetical protein
MDPDSGIECESPTGTEGDATVVIDAALATGLSGSYAEAAEAQDLPDDGLTDLERLILLSTLGAGGEAIAAAQRHPDVFACPDDPVGATILTVLEETAPQFGTVVESPVDGREVRFDTADLVGWASTAWPRFKQWINVGRVEFPPAPMQPTRFPENARVAILGDWGTNLYGAPHCARSIATDPHPPDVIVHLGDVYYTGTEKQVRTRFLEPWPQVAGAVNRACNSNHEMLSGGGPYRDLTLQTFDQSSSIWWLQNDTWDLVGLDTAWDDGTIGRLQVTWLEKVLRKARSAGRHTIAFSHHMPWRTDKATMEPGVVDPIRRLLEDRLLDGWYFGHEHLCSLFERHPGWHLFAACVGHSGYPYWAPGPEGRILHRKNFDDSSWWRREGNSEVPSSYLLRGPNPYIRGHESDYGPNGYMTIDLSEDSWVENIHEPAGQTLVRRTLRPTEAGDAGGGTLHE